MQITIIGEDTRDRSYLPDKIIEAVLKDICKDFIGIQITEVIVERAPCEQPESKYEDWAA